MSHRTQVILEDAQYARLKAESARTGLGLGELVRRAVDETYPGKLSIEEKLAIIDKYAGAFAGPEYDILDEIAARRIGPSAAERLEQLWGPGDGRP
ncbi:MAG: hypothetical protein QM572_07860 [Nocardioides sp.]|uniref:hypothetical protein n=1 Tax=Nocardioides sp. TaxID=35761 RepID=UPI0039E272B0